MQLFSWKILQSKNRKLKNNDACDKKKVCPINVIISNSKGGAFLVLIQSSLDLSWLIACSNIEEKDKIKQHFYFILEWMIYQLEIAWE